MFRDESTKVIQKAHAQWGTSESPSDGGSEGSSPSDQNEWETFLGSSSAKSEPRAKEMVRAAAVPRRVEPNLDQRGFQFFVERYLLNHPDSPNTPELRDRYIDGDAIRNVMVAVGLAGMSNLLGNKSMNLVARSKYVTALKQTGQLINSASRDFKVVAKALMSIVTLALFEVVQGKASHYTAGSANTHINGAVALVRSILPVPGAPNGGARGVLQLMFSMFVPSQMTCTVLPPGFFECLKLCKKLLSDSPDAFIVDMADTIARMIHLLYAVPQAKFIDTQAPIEGMIEQFLVIDRAFDNFAVIMTKAFPFTTHQFETPSPAFFRGKWHKYHEIWGARIWNHLRWARMLLGGQLVSFMHRYPISSARLITPPRRVQIYSVIEKNAEDLLISVPAHWHHPTLDDTTASMVAAEGQGGAGAAGLPTLLWHLVVAGTAPNVPPEFWQWSHDTLEVVWKGMGMQHALALLEVMDDHRKKLQDEAESKVIFIHEEGNIIKPTRPVARTFRTTL